MIHPLLLALLVLAGCGLKTPAPVLQQYRLDYAPPAPEAEPLPVVLRVVLFDVVDMYNREAIVYRDGPYTVGTYGQHRWLASPPRMVTDLLARDLVASDRYEAVVQGVVPVSADYDLTGYVERMEEEVIRRGCNASVAVRVLLLRSAGPADPLFQRTYTATVGCDERGPEGFVAAMSEGLSRISRAVQEDVYAAIRLELERGPLDVALDE